MIRQVELISPDYLATQQWLHAQPRGYGGRGDHWAATVIDLAKRYHVQTICDYGAGQGRLGKAVRQAGFIVRDYDPAISAMADRPEFADMVVCTDVLEHIEPEKLATVLRHIRSLARTVVFLVIATRPANKRLPDGGNTHLIIQNKVFWRARVEEAGFTVREGPTVLPEKMPGKCWMAVLRP